jgi:hypothetical protein
LKAVTYAFPPGYRENAEEEEEYLDGRQQTGRVGFDENED